MDAHVQAFCLPKDGSSVDEYEDACCPTQSGSQSAQDLRLAIADGATETSFSGLWARLLVSAFVQHSIGLSLEPSELLVLQSEWRKAVGTKTLSWYAEEKLADGAFAAFLGIQFSKDASGGEEIQSWRALAFGDSCVFQLRDGHILAAFPLQDSAAFTSRPDLLSSLPNRVVDTTKAAMTANGTWCKDDIFFLMTDALACWFLKETEIGNRPWNIIQEVSENGAHAFETWIASLRSSKVIKNDDVTLLQVTVLR